MGKSILDVERKWGQRMIITIIANKPITLSVSGIVQLLYRCFITPILRGGTRRSKVTYLSNCGSQDVKQGTNSTSP